jgi:glycerol-3-phosphate acyltransferase PlsY
VSLGSILSAATYPLFYSVLIRALFSSTAPGVVMLLTFLLAGVLILKHRGNIVRLRQGEEPRLSFRRQITPIEAIGEFYDAADTADEEVTK